MSSDDLQRVREAAFDLRFRKPKDAVRILRTIAKRGGDAGALAHGALAEILLDDLSDFDGAEHHFRQLLKAAPGLPVAELGLARALGRNGALADSQDAYARAVSGMEDRIKATIAAGEEVGGLEEALLTTLEACVEEREMVQELGGEAQVRPDPELWKWAEENRLFDLDDEVGEAAAEDWLRYAALRCILAAFDGHLADALKIVATLSKLAPLPPHASSHLNSMAHEVAGNLPLAAQAALKARELSNFTFAPEQSLRAARLLVDAERESEARELLEKERQTINERLLSAEPEEAGELKEALKSMDVQLEQLPKPSLVSLGLGKILRG